MSTKNFKRHQSPYSPKAEDPSSHWSILAFLSGAAATTMCISMLLYAWRTTGRVSYNYFTSGLPASYMFEPTSYGLYMVSFNGGSSVKTWPRIVSQICIGIDSQAPVSSGLDILVASGCPSSCVSHFRSRCSAYRELQFWGYTMFGSLLISCIMGLMGSAWLIIFGPNHTLLQIFWSIPGAVCLVAIGFWVVQSGNIFESLATTSQFPYPYVSTGVWVAVAGSSLLLLCGLIDNLASYRESCRKHRLIQEKIDHQMLKLQSGGPLPEVPGTKVPPFMFGGPVANRPSGPQIPNSMVANPRVAIHNAVLPNYPPGIGPGLVDSRGFPIRVAPPPPPFY